MLKVRMKPIHIVIQMECGAANIGNDNVVYSLYEDDGEYRYGTEIPASDDLDDLGTIDEDTFNQYREKAVEESNRNIDKLKSVIESVAELRTGEQVPEHVISMAQELCEFNLEATANNGQKIPD